MNKRTYKIELSAQEREYLQEIILKAKENASTLLRANILLLSDSSNKPEMSVVEIAEITGTSRQTVTKIRNLFHEEGLSIALRVLERNRNRMCLNHSSDFLEKIKLIIKEPPKNGRPKWSVRAISQECIERKYVQHINPTTIMRILKENNIQL